MTYVEVLARWNVGGIGYFELMRDAQGYFYRTQGAVMKFQASKTEDAISTVEKIIQLQFPEVKVMKEIL